MAAEDPKDLERIDREIRINELKHEAAELTGGRMTGWESDDCPPELAESFWERVVEYEKAPLTSHFKQLTDAGVELLPPEAMTDAALAAKLEEVFRRLAERRVFFSQTNHLSDRELYALLWTDLLREVVADVPYDDHSAYCVDILGACSEEDIYLKMKYYATEEQRRDWQKDFPDDPMPAHEDPPYDRDRHLPRSGL